MVDSKSFKDSLLPRCKFNVVVFIWKLFKIIIFIFMAYQLILKKLWNIGRNIFYFYLSGTSWASLLISDLAPDGGGVQQLQHVGAAQRVRGAAVLLAVARSAHDLAWKTRINFAIEMFDFLNWSLKVEQL